MTDVRERLVQWLRDAHAAEEQANTLLLRTASQIDGHPEFSGGLERHGQESSEQAAELRACLERLGEGPSALKQLAGQIAAFGQTLSGYVVGDEPVKAALAISSFAHMEAASYRVLAVAADAAGEQEIVALAERFLDAEIRFAEWVDDQVPEVTRRYLSLTADPAPSAASLTPG